MLTTRRKPATVGKILTEEFMQPMGLTQGALAEAMGVQRKDVNELCGNRRNVTAATALILARVFGNGPDFWLDLQRRSDLREVMSTPKERERVERARPLQNTARARPACRGRRGRGSHHGIEVPAATDARGGKWRKPSAHSGTECGGPRPIVMITTFTL